MCTLQIPPVVFLVLLLFCTPNLICVHTFCVQQSRCERCTTVIHITIREWRRRLDCYLCEPWPLARKRCDNLRHIWRPCVYNVAHEIANNIFSLKIGSFSLVACVCAYVCVCACDDDDNGALAQYSSPINTLFISTQIVIGVAWPPLFRRIRSGNGTSKRCRYVSVGALGCYK